MKSSIIDLVGFAIWHLGITAQEFFTLVEEINDQSKQDYTHQVIREVVKRIEEEGLAYNEIFTKRIRLLHELMKQGSDEFRSEFADYLRYILDLGAGDDFVLVTSEENVKEKEVGQNDVVLMDLRKFQPAGKGTQLAKNLGDWGIKTKEIDGLSTALYLAGRNYADKTVVMISPMDAFIQVKREVLSHFGGVLSCVKAFKVRESAIEDSLVGGDALVTVWNGEMPLVRESEQVYFGQFGSRAFAELLYFDGESFEKTGDIERFLPGRVDFESNLLGEGSGVYLKENGALTYDQSEKEIEEGKVREAIIYSLFSDKMNLQYPYSILEEFEYVFANALPLFLASGKNQFDRLEFDFDFEKHLSVRGKDLWQLIQQIWDRAESLEIGGTFVDRFVAVKNDTVERMLKEKYAALRKEVLRSEEFKKCLPI